MQDNVGPLTVVFMAILVILISSWLFAWYDANGASRQSLPGAGPNLKATRWVTSPEAMQAHVEALARKGQYKGPVESVPTPIAPSESVTWTSAGSRLVVDVLKATDGMILYCVHWQPCERCDFQCVRR